MMTRIDVTTTYVVEPRHISHSLKATDSGCNKEPLILLRMLYTDVHM